MKTVSALIIALIVALSVPVYSENANLAANPGFEDAGGDDPYFWTSSSWQNDGRLSLDRTQAHSGKASALIVNGKATDSRYKQQITVRADTYYRLTCWIKTENVGAGAKGANISIDGLTDTSQDIQGTSGDWVYVELYGKSGVGQESFVLTLGLGGYSSENTGKAWFDDVAVEELEGAPAAGSIVRLFKTEAADSGPGNSRSRDYPGVNPVFIFLLILMALLFGLIAYFALRKKQKNKQSANKSETVHLKFRLDKKRFKNYVRYDYHISFYRADKSWGSHRSRNLLDARQSR